MLSFSSIEKGIMLRFNFVKKIMPVASGGSFFASFCIFIFLFIAFITPAYAIGLDLGVAKVGLSEDGLKASAGKGIVSVSATISPCGLAGSARQEVTTASTGLGAAPATADSPKVNGGESSPVAEHLAKVAKDATASLAGSDSGKDVSVDPFRVSKIAKNKVIDKVPEVSSSLVELDGILADAEGLTKGLVSTVTSNDTHLEGVPAVFAAPVISPATDIASKVLEPVKKLNKGAVATVAVVPVAGPVIEKTIMCSAAELVDNATGRALVPIVDRVLDQPSTLLTPLLGTADELLETNLTHTIQSLLTFISDEGNRIIRTVDGLLPINNEILEPIGGDTGSNYVRDGPGERSYNPMFLPGEETNGSRVSLSWINIVPETGSFRELTFNNKQSAFQGERHLPHQNNIYPYAERLNHSPVSGMNINAGSGFGAGGNQAAISNTIFKLDRLPLNGAITEFLDPDRIPPFIALFSPPG